MTEAPDRRSEDAPGRGPDRQHDLGDCRVLAVKTGRWKENAYVVVHRPSRDALVIDPGGEADRLSDLIAGEDAHPSLILLTHAHFDHVGALDDLCRRYDQGFYMHDGDAKLLRRAGLYAMSFERRAVTVPATYQSLDGADLAWAGGEIAVIPTPGHTDGSVCYDLGGLCFTGDTLMKRLIGRTDLPGSSGGDLKASVTRLLDQLTPETTLFGGHGAPWTVDEARAWWAEQGDSPPEYAMEGVMR